MPQGESPWSRRRAWLLWDDLTSDEIECEIATLSRHGPRMGLVLAATPSCFKNSASLIVVELRGIEGAAMVSAESVELWDELTSDEIDCEITALWPTAALGYGIMGLRGMGYRDTGYGIMGYGMRDNGIQAG